MKRLVSQGKREPAHPFEFNSRESQVLLRRFTFLFRGSQENIEL